MVREKSWASFQSAAACPSLSFDCFQCGCLSFCCLYFFIESVCLLLCVATFWFGWSPLILTSAAAAAKSIKIYCLWIITNLSILYLAHHQIIGPYKSVCSWMNLIHSYGRAKQMLDNFTTLWIRIEQHSTERMIQTIANHTFDIERQTGKIVCVWHTLYAYGNEFTRILQVSICYEAIATCYGLVLNLHNVWIEGNKRRYQTRLCAQFELASNHLIHEHKAKHRECERNKNWLSAQSSGSKTKTIEIFH